MEDAKLKLRSENHGRPCSKQVLTTLDRQRYVSCFGSYYSSEACAIQLFLVVTLIAIILGCACWRIRLSWLVLVDAQFLMILENASKSAEESQWLWTEIAESIEAFLTTKPTPDMVRYLYVDD